MLQWRKYDATLKENLSPTMTALEKLRVMFMNHITNIKFSNFAIMEHRTDIIYDRWQSFIHMVDGRGGTCSVLSYYFASFLEAEGYQVRLVRCNKMHPQTKLYDLVFHTAIIATIDHVDYFVDVGYGKYFDEIFPLIEGQKSGVLTVHRDSAGLGWRLMKGDEETLHVLDDTSLTFEELASNLRFALDLAPEHRNGLRRALFERIYDKEQRNYVDPNIPRSRM